MDEKSRTAGLCHDCRLANGWKMRDRGYHTAVMAKCKCCGETKAILPGRHWVKS